MAEADPKYVYGRVGTDFETVKGELTGGQHHCALEGCNGRRLAVRWPDGKRSFPCTRGMGVRPDGEWQIV